MVSSRLQWQLLALVTHMLFTSQAADKFHTDYMNSQCNRELSRTSGRLESSSALTYDSQLNCYTTITVPQQHQILLWFRRFEVEEEVNGVCVDIFNMHDGAAITSPRLNENGMCGLLTEQLAFSNFTTSSNQVTFHFTTDATAVYRGFEIIYTAYHIEPCGTTEFACNNSLCIDAELECDYITQCGDDSDEDEIRCANKEEEQYDEGNLVGIIVGCSVGGLCLIIIIAVVIYKLYDYYKWKLWLDKPNPWESTQDLYQYPVTDKYSVYDIGKKGRRRPDVNPYFVEGPDPITADEYGRYLDEK